ncbi:hypothetical protein HHUSO_G2484, partial [Huso huso]
EHNEQNTSDSESQDVMMQFEMNGDLIVSNDSADFESEDTMSGSDREDEKACSLRGELKDWAVGSNIPMCHINSLLGILRRFFPSLPKDARTLMATSTSYNLETVAGGTYHHFGVAQGILSQLASNMELASNNCVTLQINIDGIPLFKSSNVQFWPILGLLEEDKNKNPFIIGLFVGKSKPKDANSYLKYFVDEMKHIQNEGMSFDGKLVKVTISNFVCDAPARPFVKSVKNHNGYSGCEKCVQNGVWESNRMTFPEVGAAPRTDVMFDEMVDEDHHMGDCSLRKLKIGMVSQFPLDFMHLVCLGVMRRLLLLWIKGPLPTRTGGQHVKLISESIVNFVSFLPREFARKGRSLAEIDRWKATEFRTFLLYTGPVALKGKIPDALYYHFLMLHVGITILCSPLLCTQYCDYAEELLVLFVQQFASVYGNIVVYNIHGLVHLANDVRKFGPLQNFSAFPFENYLQIIKRMIRKPKYPLQQVIRRLSEKKCAGQSKQLKRGCKKEHFSGPLPANILPCFRQFKELHMDTFMISVNTGDNAILVDQNIFLVKNIIVVDDVTSLVCQKFSVKVPFFQYPVDSLKINIAFVKDPQHYIVHLPVPDISAKVVLLPYNDGFVAFPLNHTLEIM